MGTGNQLHTPEKVAEELDRRGYTCGLFYDGYDFSLLKVYEYRRGGETKRFAKRVKEHPEELVGVYDPDTMFGDIAADMAFVRQQRKAA